MKMSRVKTLEYSCGATQVQPEECPQWKLDVEKVLDRLASEGHFLGWARKHGFYDGGWCFHNSHTDGVTTYTPNLTRDVPWALAETPKDQLPMILATGELGSGRTLYGLEHLYLARYCEMALSGELSRED